MHNIFLITLLILSCVAANAARADIVASNGAVVVTGNRFSNSDNSSRPFYRQPYNQPYQVYDNFRGNDQVILNNGGSNGALIVKDGNVIIPQDGTHDLGNGSNINVDKGRVNGRVGGVDIRN